MIEHEKWRDSLSAIISTKKVLKYAKKYNTKAHILHISTADEIQLLQNKGKFITVEVTPQHLTLFSPECYNKLGSLAQMNPPIRSLEHQIGLWKGISNGTVNVIGSDHAPHTLEEKKKQWPNSPSGMPGVQTTLSIMLNHVNIKKLTLQKLIELLTRAKKHVNEWQVEDKSQSRKIKKLNSEVNLLIKKLTTQNLPNIYLLKYFFDQTKNLSIETQEIVASILIELAPNKFEGIEECLANPNEPKLVPSMLISELIEIIRNDYDWVFKLDLRKKSSDTNFWYISQEKLEPRLGNRYEEKGSELEMPFKIPHYVKLLKSLLEKYPNKNDTVASFLLKNPSERFIIRRIQNNARYPYSEIRDNLVDKNCKPIDMLRCKLSFFGASKFDPKSDKWTRVTLFQGAPIASEFFSNKKNYDDWSFATLTN